MNLINASIKKKRKDGQLVSERCEEHNHACEVPHLHKIFGGVRRWKWWGTCWMLWEARNGRAVHRCRSCHGRRVAVNIQHLRPTLAVPPTTARRPPYFHAARTRYTSSPSRDCRIFWFCHKRTKLVDIQLFIHSTLTWIWINWRSRVFIHSTLGPPHGQQSRQDVNEDPADPRRHLVCLRRPEVDVEYHHSHADTNQSNNQQRDEEER